VGGSLYVLVPKQLAEYFKHHNQNKDVAEYFKHHNQNKDV